jgi:peptidoglycan/LPS O-acetylase OafA/YrhL
MKSEDIRATPKNPKPGHEKKKLPLMLLQKVTPPWFAPSGSNALETKTAGRPDARRGGYRPDIDGLRAVAVLSVVAYHYTFHHFQGGFIGVDIFFVISGFLISGNIIAELEAKRFSFLDFYQRRIRRIFPALALVLLFTYAVGLLFFNRADQIFDPSIASFDELSKSIAAGAGFFSNFLLLKNANYFNESALSQPLLHLWSLAIEEQFYIVWPFLLYVAHRFNTKYLVVALAIGAVSFYINISIVHRDPVAAYYSPLSRSWELMLGAALASLAPAGKAYGHFGVARESQSIAGLVLIALGLWLISDSSAFPGWIALLPTLGALLCISAGPDAWLNKNLLGNRLAVGVGLISYPLYLWHWPALWIYEKYLIPRIYTPAGHVLAIGAAFAVSVVASTLTFLFVERPIRFGSHKTVWGASLFALMLAIGVCAATTSALVDATAPGLSPYQGQTIAKLRQVTELKDLKKMYGENPCVKSQLGQTFDIFVENGCFEIKYPGRKSVFLIGDSHSASLSLGLRPLLERERINFFQVSTGYCEPTSNNAIDRTCTNINEMTEIKIAELKPDILIIDEYWIVASRMPYFVGFGDYFSRLLQKIDDLKRLGVKRLIIVGEIPVWFPSLPRQLYTSYVLNDLPIPARTFSGVNEESIGMDGRMRSLGFPEGVTYLSVKDALCNETGCLTAVGPNLETDIIVWDYGHLTAAGADYLTRTLIEPKISDIFDHH